jgi:hypothetical protein
VSGRAASILQQPFLRDLAKPVLELDSHAKIQVRGKIPGGQVKSGQ